MLSPVQAPLGDHAHNDRANTLAAVQCSGVSQFDSGRGNTLDTGQLCLVPHGARARVNTLTPGQRGHDHQHKCAGVFPKEGK